MKNNNLKLICAFVLTLLISFLALTSYENISSVEASRITYNNVSRTNCVHNWKAATCTSPRTCTKCNMTQGDALGHNVGYEYQDSTNHKIYCMRCGATFGTGTHSYGSWSVSKSPTCTSYRN